MFCPSSRQYYRVLWWPYLYCHIFRGLECLCLGVHPWTCHVISLNLNYYVLKVGRLIHSHLTGFLGGWNEMTHQTDLCKTVMVYMLSTYFVIKSFNKGFFFLMHIMYQMFWALKTWKYGDQLLVFTLRSHIPGIRCISFLLQQWWVTKSLMA